MLKIIMTIDKQAQKRQITTEIKLTTYIFNPEHDLALAYGTEGYTAPPRAQQLRRDLQMLPAWYCEEGNGGTEILSQNIAEDAAWLMATGLPCRPVAINRLQCRHSRYRPWGWNLDLRGRLLNACVPTADLPMRDQLLTVQELSHRRTTILIHKLLAEVTGTTFSPLPVEAHSVDEVRHFNAAYPQCYIKAPWSGSGKGIYRVLDADSRNFAIWTQGVINRQGSIMCEQPLDKVMDFAMEFRCQAGTAHFAGYSVFFNDSHCSYDSGIIAGQDELERIITSRLGQSANYLHMISAALSKILTGIVAPHYEGYLGIDMMIYRDRCGTLQLNPCVEMNLRMTMGMVSAIIADRHLVPGSTATFRVTYHKSPDEVRTAISHLSQKHPLKTSGGKIVSGFMPLTPTYDDSHFLAAITATTAGITKL